MIRGTTAKFKFEIPYPFSELNTTTEVIFWQPGNDNMSPILKTIDNGGCCCGASNQNELWVTLSSEETKLFRDDLKGKGQLYGTVDGTDTRFASLEQVFTVYPLYKNCDLGAIGTEPVVNNMVILDAGDIG